MADLVVGIDCSTTACKAIAWDAEGTAVAEGRGAIALDNPTPDAWQQDAEGWWRALGEACRQLATHIDARRVAAACVTNQRETFVVTDDAGRPLHPALVWMDHRCHAQVERAVQSLGEEHLHRLSGKPPCTTPSLYKLMFLLEEQPALAAARVLDVHAFVAWRLTGRFATSLAAADPTGLVDMEARAWSRELAALAGIDVAQLPALVAPGDRLGVLTAGAAAHTALPAGVPLVAGAGDGQCAGLGAGIVAGGRAYLNLGTAIVSGVLSSDYRCDRAFRTLYGAAPGTFFLETDLHGGTFVVSWLFEKLLGRPLGDLEALAAEAARLPPGADGLVLLPYWGGVMNPYWDDAASGAVIGWRGSHGPAHLYRAILEGIALEQRLHLEGVEEAVGRVDELVVMGGGSKSDLWCQILADVLERPIVRAGSSEATALGAGILAAVHGGLHPDVEAAARAMTRLGQRFEPGPARPFYQRLYDEVYRGLYLALRGRMKRLWQLRALG
jgi:sugar (pentulose or hexulose) kinase